MVRPHLKITSRRLTVDRRLSEEFWFKFKIDTRVDVTILTFDTNFGRSREELC